MNTIEQAREVSKRLSAITSSSSKNTFLVASATIDALILEVIDKEIMNTGLRNEIAKATVERDHALDVCDSYKAELDEQCRLNGMGSEREASLLGKVERQRKALGQALDALQKLWLLGDAAAITANPAITAIQGVLK